MMDKKELNVMDKKELEIMEMDKVSGGDLSDINWEGDDPAIPPWEWSGEDD